MKLQLDINNMYDSHVPDAVKVQGGWTFRWEKNPCEVEPCSKPQSGFFTCSVVCANPAEVRRWLSRKRDILDSRLADTWTRATALGRRIQELRSYAQTPARQGGDVDYRAYGISLALGAQYNATIYLYRKAVKIKGNLVIPSNKYLVTMASASKDLPDRIFAAHVTLNAVDAELDRIEGSLAKGAVLILEEEDRP